jgi:hypothetical protein
MARPRTSDKSAPCPSALREHSLERDRVLVDSESEPVLQHGMFLALASAVEQVLSSRSVGGARESRWRPTSAMASFTVLRQRHSGWLSSRWLRAAEMLMLFQGGAFLLLAARIVHRNSERSANVSTTLA